MKPRTKEEKKVMALSEKMPSITKAQKEWAKNLYTAEAFTNKRYAWCSECGHPLPYKRSKLLIDVLDNKCVCPHCGKELEIKNNSLGTHKFDNLYFMVATTCKGYQVYRHYLITKVMKLNDNAYYHITEVVQNWINNNGKETIVARSTSSNCYYEDYWLVSSDLSIKHMNRYSYYSWNRYDITPNKTYPIKRYIPELRRNGFDGDFHKITPNVLTKSLLSNNELEYLMKTNQTSVLVYMLNKDVKTIPFKHALNICNRNHYIVSDATLWYDMLNALEYLGKDTHSPFYVCPTDLKASHDKFVEQMKRKKEKEKEKEERKKAMQWENQYKEMKEKFFGLTISNDNLVIKVLQSVAEFLEEGTEMHHCVYHNGYYKNKECLILSAKDMNGKRIETIEVSLKTFNIIQSRGVCNSQTKYHKEIIDLMNENMYKIKKITSIDKQKAVA